MIAAVAKPFKDAKRAAEKGREGACEERSRAPSLSVGIETKRRLCLHFCTLGGSASAVPIFEACSAFTHVTACLLAKPCTRTSNTGDVSGLVTQRLLRLLPAARTVAGTAFAATDSSRLRAAPHSAVPFMVIDENLTLARKLNHAKAAAYSHQYACGRVCRLLPRFPGTQDGE
jgi:hypothetical protein